MKSSIRNAPAPILAQYENLRTGAGLVEADEFGAIEYAVGQGYMPDPPATPHHDRLRAAIQDGHFAGVLAIRQTHGWQLLQEERAIKRFGGLKEWALGPSAEEERAAAKAERERAAREAEIEARANELLQSEAAERLAKARQKARKEVEGK